MSEIVVLVFESAIDPQEFHELVQRMGGVIDPGAPESVRLMRDDDVVWVYGPEGETIGDDPDADAEYEHVLGAPRAADVTLHLSRSPGSRRLAMDIVEAIASHGWRFVVDNGEDVLTFDDLRRRAARSPSIFW